MKGLCAIISGGEYSPMDDIKAAEYIIACDRGYSYAKRSGIVPDLLLGDFDSYTGKLPEGAAVERLPREKDDTDTMHAVRRALELGFTRISLYCALGGRLDHTLANLIGRFEKKIHDLELTRTISVQMAPQIRMVQNNDSLMAEKIRSSIVNTIPLWKNQMVLALSLYHSEQAMQAQRNVTDVTNELLMKNAKTLHQGSVNVAKESERGIVDMETLKQTNLELIATLDEVRQIQDDGRARRAQAEDELARIEGELKDKLLEMKG